MVKKYQQNNAHRQLNVNNGEPELLMKKGIIRIIKINIFQNIDKRL